MVLLPPGGVNGLLPGLSGYVSTTQGIGGQQPLRVAVGPCASERRSRRFASWKYPAVPLSQSL